MTRCELLFTMSCLTVPGKGVALLETLPTRSPLLYRVIRTVLKIASLEITT
jgi:hypothetical protein